MADFLLRYIQHRLHYYSSSSYYSYERLRSRKEPKTIMKRIDLSGSYIEVEDIKNAIVGKTLRSIRYDDQHLFLIFDEDYLSLTVYGDCCSSSYFHDFYGVDRVMNHKITDFTSIELDPTDLKASHNGDVVEVYGYKIVCEPGANDIYYDGQPTAVFSFRNDSNGYYGGSLEAGGELDESVPAITKDVYST